MVRWQTKTLSSRMARYEHYQFVCEDCGQTYNLSRYDRMVHWLTCKSLRSITGGFKTACSTLLRLKSQEK